MHPVRFQIKDQKQNGTQRPGKRIRPEDHADGRYDAHDDCYVCNADDAPADQHHEHRHDRFSGSAHQPCNTVREREQEIKQCNGPRLLCSVCDHLRITVKSRNKYWHGNVKDNADQLGKDQAAYNSKTGSLFDTVIFFCSEVLTDECCQCHGEACDRQKAESLYLRIGAAAGNCHFTKSVNVRLNYYICD